SRLSWPALDPIRKGAEEKASQAENLRKMLLAMCRDIRVIIIKLADRLHNLMTLKYLPPQKQQRIAQETLEIYAPLAHRLGIAKIQWDMEDLCLRYLEPDVYFDLVRKVNEKRQERDGFIQKLKGEVEEVTRKGGIEARVTGRPKSFYSIYKKTLKRDKTLSEIYDLVGVRVITQTIPNCYEVLGLLHETWKPLPNRFKDYIAVPKANMYQSLHTTLIHPDGKVFEVQIRTEDMDRIAETGVAAHWAYKDGGDPKKEVQEKLTWLRQILDWSKEVTDSSEFVDGLKLDLFQNQVYVFTPNGRVVELPAGATPLDFAYAIHTDVGHTCVGAHVNGKIVPLTFELKNGQIVHIITNKNSKGPSRDWLDVVKSSRARNKIKQFLKNENREEYLIKGREIVQEELKKALKGHPDPNLTPGAILKSEELRNEIKVAGFLDLNSFFASVGRNEFPIVGFVKGLSVFKDQAPEPALPPTRPPTTPLKSSLVGSKGILVAGMNDMLVRLSKCCNPVVGDGIVGYITRGRGVSVHRVDCPNIEMLKADKDRQVGVSWDLPSLQGKDTRFLVEIEARVYDRPNVLLKVTNVISNYKLNIHAAQARITRQGQGLLSFSLE
ncbi:MAG: bifunctional (p)ppGpp synthetase/guanosine-3',5'-bis(diphosphate) 3'-pyrophosphohydrolase, partial [Candidatus Riflebacteria bacterium]|nr:bifunctional (p)ppGpp synthetase/guanosine-3',5'-bis(diphosphate) 3'-pyrophosphohydrolase [Candidatus Riflebacteria bacterium]